jgi:hypothetical protein
MSTCPAEPPGLRNAAVKNNGPVGTHDVSAPERVAEDRFSAVVFQQRSTDSVLSVSIRESEWSPSP